MFGASDDMHFAWYEAAAGFFALGGLYTAARLRRRHEDVLLLLATLTLGLPFYQMAAAMYLTSTENLLGVQHLTCLLAHLTCLAWNFTTVLVVRTWCTGSLGRLRRIVIALPFMVSAVTLISVFLFLYPGPSEQNYLLSIRSSLPGHLYIGAYAVPLLVAKGYIVATGISMMRHLRRTDAKLALQFVVVGSAGIGLYALCRLMLALSPLIPVGNPGTWELIPTCAHVTGAACYLAGVVFPTQLAAAHHYVRDTVICLRLNRITVAGRRCFPGLGPCPRLRAGDLLTPSRVNQQLVRQIAYLSDIWILLRRRYEVFARYTPVSPHAHNDPMLSDSCDDFLDDCARYVAAAARYRRSRGGEPTDEERMYGAFAAA